MSKLVLYYSKCAKRSMDIVLSLMGLLSLSLIILIGWIIAAVETKSNGFFFQPRVGQKGRVFSVIKIKTMFSTEENSTSVTTTNDARITRSGRIFRKYKIDELPQLINVLIGNMSLVGPRPDVPGFADLLEGEDRIILSIKPGITGPASIFFKNEEELLALQADPEQYNLDVIWPKKVDINKQYIHNWSFSKDLYYIYKTIFS